MLPLNREQTSDEGRRNERTWKYHFTLASVRVKEMKVHPTTNIMVKDYGSFSARIAVTTTWVVDVWAAWLVDKGDRDGLEEI